MLSDSEARVNRKENGALFTGVPVFFFSCAIGKAYEIFPLLIKNRKSV